MHNAQQQNLQVMPKPGGPEALQNSMFAMSTEEIWCSQYYGNVLFVTHGFITASHTLHPQNEAMNDKPLDPSLCY